MLTVHDLLLNKQITVLKSYVWSALFYGCETWTFNMNVENDLKLSIFGALGGF